MTLLAGTWELLYRGIRFPNPGLGHRLRGWPCHGMGKPVPEIDKLSQQLQGPSSKTKLKLPLSCLRCSNVLRLHPSNACSLSVHPRCRRRRLCRRRFGFPHVARPSRRILAACICWGIAHSPPPPIIARHSRLAPNTWRIGAGMLTLARMPPVSFSSAFLFSVRVAASRFSAAPSMRSAYISGMMLMAAPWEHGWVRSGVGTAVP